MRMRGRSTASVKGVSGKMKFRDLNLGVLVRCVPPMGNSSDSKVCSLLAASLGNAGSVSFRRFVAHAGMSKLQFSFAVN